MMAKVEEVTKAKKEKIAEHSLLAADGTEVDNEEDADGIRYKMVGGDSFDWYWSQASEAARKLHALFGAKTLATNVTSGVRQKDEDAPVGVQLDAVKERFELIEGGQWVDRTREPGVPRIDREALAEAISQYLVAVGKRTQDEMDKGEKARVRQRIEEEKDYVSKARTIPEVATNYARIVGRKTASADDLV